MSELHYEPVVGDLVFTFQPSGGGWSSWSILITEKPVLLDVGGKAWHINRGVIDGILVENDKMSACIDIPSADTPWARVIFHRGVPVAWGGNLDLLRTHVPNLPPR